ncbi:uncharacterized protein [Oscarella lobularis]|uniref:uncharacterized protein n=1 Tax=Oscarella lobularis TaxID=121494 RepID=UPI0033139C1A
MWETTLDIKGNSSNTSGIMIVFLILACFYVVDSSSPTVRPIRTVRIGVLIPPVKAMNQPLKAVQLAVKEINDDPSILPNYRLDVVHNNTGYDRWETMQAALWQLNVARVAGIIGGSDASAVKLLSPLLKKAKVPLLSPSAVDYELSSEDLYPTFFRICPNDRDLALALHDFLYQYAWRRVAVIHSDDDYGRNGVRKTIELARTFGYSIIGAVFLKRSGSDTISQDEIEQIRQLASTQARIFVVVVPGYQVNVVLETASNAGLLSKGTAWIVLRCNSGTDLLSPASMAGIICVTQHIEPDTMETFGKKMKTVDSAEKNPWLESIYAYEATKILAQSLHRVLTSDALLGYPSGEQSYIPIERPYGNNLIEQLVTGIFEDVTASTTFTLFDRGLNTTSSGYDFTFYKNGTLIKFGDWTTVHLLRFNSEAEHISWPGGQLVVPQDTPKENEKNVFNVLVPISWPFTGLIDPKTNETCEASNWKNCQFAGVAIELLKRIAASSKLKLQLNLTLWTGSWTEMVRIVGNESTPYDMACGSVTVTSERLQLARFTHSFYDSGLRFAVKRPTENKKDYFAFFEPFGWSVWLVLVVAFIFSAVVLMYLDPEAVSTDSTRAFPKQEISDLSRKLHNWADAMYFSFCTAFYVHKAEDVTKIFGHIFVFTLSFFVFIVTAAYTANMAAFLTSRGYVTATLATYKELVDDYVGCRNGTSNWNFVKTELNLGRHLVPVSGPEEAAELLKAGKIAAYVADTPHVLGMEARDCDIIVMGRQEQEQVYAFPTKRTLPVSTLVDREIADAIREDFVIESLNRILDNKCPVVSLQGQQDTITISDMGGLFILSSAVAVAAIIAKGLAYVKRKAKDKIWQSYVRQNESDVKDLIDGTIGTYRRLLETEDT